MNDKNLFDENENQKIEEQEKDIQQEKENQVEEKKEEKKSAEVKSDEEAFKFLFHMKKIIVVGTYYFTRIPNYY